VALAGYDPVSYFSGKPSEGDDQLAYQHEGVTYLFATAANASFFERIPVGMNLPMAGGARMPWVHREKK
jgi:hypothetical protein